jgi:hypothetical protein
VNITHIDMLNLIALLLPTSGPCTSGESFCQLHTAIGKHGSLRVSWVSSLAANGKPTVEWGLTQGELNQSTAPTYTTTYRLDDMCAPDLVLLRGWEAPGLIHHAELPGALLGDGQIFYRVGDAGTQQWSSVAGPVRASFGMRSTVRVALLADMGTYAYAPHDTVDAATRLRACDDQVAASLARAAAGIDAVVHFGDLAYAHDGPASRWRYWFDEIEPTAKTTPYMAGCGNHDCLWGFSRKNPHGPPWRKAVISAGGDGGQCGLTTDARFWMPGEPARIGSWAESRNGTRNNLFYSFDVGTAVHVAMVSTEHDLSPNSTQLRWLEADLASVDRSLTPFVLLALHRPMYTSTTDGYSLPETKGVRGAIEPLLVRHRVTGVFAGHFHQYERSCAITQDGVCSGSRGTGSSGHPPRQAQGKGGGASGGQEHGTVHVTAGIAGLSHHSDWVKQTPPWVIVQSTGKFGYVLLDVVNATHAHCRAIDATDNDTVFDEFWLRAPEGRP